MPIVSCSVCVFFFNDTATTEIYTLSLHDALPISAEPASSVWNDQSPLSPPGSIGDRKSTRLNSSHPSIAYAVFCLKKKKTCRVELVSAERGEVHQRGRTARGQAEAVLRQERATDAERDVHSSFNDPEAPEIYTLPLHQRLPL